MIKSELWRIIKSKKSKVIILIFFIIPFIDLLMNIYSCYYNYYVHHSDVTGRIPFEDIYHPSKASFLTGTSEGHITQMLLIWILPLYLLIMYCDSYIADSTSGYNNILFSKYEKKKVLLSKLFVGFFISFIVSLCSLSFNFVLANIFFHGGTTFRGSELFTNMLPNVQRVSIQLPYISYCIYILIFSIITGGCGVLCVALSFIIKKYKYLYIISFFIWFIQIIAPKSLTFAMQPFIEYGLDYIIPAIILFVAIVVIITSISTIYKVKTDEI